MATSRPASTRSSRFWQAPTSALILWGCLWSNLNTGFWNIHSPKDAGELLDLIRAVLPFAVLPAAAFLLLRRRRLNLPRIAASRLLMVYGVFAAFATIFSPVPMTSLEWSISFLATILAAWTFVDRGDPMESARQLLLVTWVATFIVAAIIGYQARNSVFSSAVSGYGIVEGELRGLSRSSGVARWAAVPGLVCLVRAYHTRRPSLIAFFLVAAAVSFYIVYRMQSRGAIFGSAAALLFALLVSSRMRRYALPFAVVAFVVLLLLDPSGFVSNRVDKYLRRGESREDFLSMTGRTRAYEHGIAAFEDAPFFGYGQWGDRLTISEHVHNSFLQALLNGGLFGGIPYSVSWIAGWILFYRVQKRSDRLRPDDRVHVLECGTVMMFFTVRAMPETTTASFSVDLLVMVAVYVYFETLNVSMACRPPRHLALMLPRASVREAVASL